MIDAWGVWNLFQELMSTLNRIAQKYNVSIANVATRYILETCSSRCYYRCQTQYIYHINNNAQVFDFNLDNTDYDDIDAVCTKSNNLFETIGDCGDEYG